MKLSYLREFVLLSQELNFSNAAAKLFISQSALSRHVSILEAELGDTLLERDTHNVKLTHLGLRASQTFADILYQYDSLTMKDEASISNITGKLSVGLLYFAVAEFYGDFLQQFQEKYPGINLEIRNGHPHRLYRSIIDKQLDICDMFYARGLLFKGIVFHKMYPINMVALLPENHPLAQKESISLKEAESMPLIDLEEDTISSISTQEIIRNCGALFTNTRYVKDVEAAPSAVLKFNGIHITGARVSRQSYPGIRYVPINDKKAIGYHCFIHQTDNPNKLLPLFIREARTYFDNHMHLIPPAED